MKSKTKIQVNKSNPGSLLCRKLKMLEVTIDHSLIEKVFSNVSNKIRYYQRCSPWMETCNNANLADQKIMLKLCNHKKHKKLVN